MLPVIICPCHSNEHCNDCQVSSICQYHKPTFNDRNFVCFCDYWHELTSKAFVKNANYSCNSNLIDMPQIVAPMPIKNDNMAFENKMGIKAYTQIGFDLLASAIKMIQANKNAELLVDCAYELHNMGIINDYDYNALVRLVSNDEYDFTNVNTNAINVSNVKIIYNEYQNGFMPMPILANNELAQNTKHYHTQIGYELMARQNNEYMVNELFDMGILSVYDKVMILV